MPRLTFCGRLLPVASDEFVFSAVCQVLVRLLWLAVLAASVIVVEKKTEGCG